MSNIDDLKQKIATEAGIPVESVVLSDYLDDTKINAVQFIDDMGDPNFLQEGWDDLSGKTAAKELAKGISEASDITTEAGKAARQDLIDNFGPAWGTVLYSAAKAADELATGSLSVSDLLTQTGIEANQILGNGQQGAISALLGIPVGQPQQPYQQQVQAMPGSPEAAQEAQVRAQNGEPQAQIPHALAPPRSQGGGMRAGQIGQDSIYGTPQQAQGTASQAVLRKDAQGNRVDAQGNIIPDAQASQLQQTTPGQGLQAGQQQIPQTGTQVALPDGTIGDPNSFGQPVGQSIATPSTVQPVQDIAAGANQQFVLPQGAQIGLAGAENALMTAQQGGSQSLMTGAGIARGDIGQAFQTGQGFVNQGLQNARNAFQPLSAGRVSGDSTKALNAIQQGVDAGVGELSGFRTAGETALQKEMALSGALGPEAQQMAMDQFIESPGQQFLRERQEQSLLRNSAAIGGLGGGNVRSALQEQAFGIAAKQQQQQLENLRSLSQMGLSAATTQGGFRTQGGIAGGQIESQLEQAGMSANASLMGQELQTRAAQQRALADIESRTGMSLAEMAMRTGLSQAEIANQLGINLSNQQIGIGGQISGLRAGAGADVANIISNTAGAQAGNVSGIGMNLANNAGQTAVNTSNLMSGTGINLANIQTGLGTGLANTGLGVGSQQAGFAQAQGQAQASGSMGTGNLLNQIIGGGVGMMLSGGNPFAAVAGASAAGSSPGGLYGPTVSQGTGIFSDQSGYVY